MKSSFTASLKTMALLLSSLLIPTQAFAHLRWFVDVNSPSAQAYQQAMSRFQFDLVYLFLLAGAVGFVISAITLDNLARKTSWLELCSMRPSSCLCIWSGGWFLFFLA